MSICNQGAERSFNLDTPLPVWSNLDHIFKFYQVFVYQYATRFLIHILILANNVRMIYSYTLKVWNDIILFNLRICKLKSWYSSYCI